LDKVKELYQEYRIQIIGGIIAVLILVAISFFMLNQKGRADSPTLNGTQTGNSMVSPRKVSGSSASTQSSGFQQTASSDGHKQIYIDVKGAVKNPGVYQVTANMRVNDAIDLAGGFNRSADQKHINLAQSLTDQQVVYVPVKGEVKGEPGAMTGTPVESSSSTPSETPNSSNDSPDAGGTKVNLNQADASQLQELSGIGEKKAEDIIQYREAHGEFKSVNDLTKISGFGDKTVEKISENATV